MREQGRKSKKAFSFQVSMCLISSQTQGLAFILKDIMERGVDTNTYASKEQVSDTVANK